MIQIKRVDNSDLDFQELVQLLDTELAERDGDDNAFYAQFNGLEALKRAVVLYHDDQAVACGAFKAFDSSSVEIKRMYVSEAYRKRGYAGQILHALETWAAELGYQRMVLETGKRQSEAVALYQKHHYQRIPNYDPYTGIENSLCFAKALN